VLAAAAPTLHTFDRQPTAWARGRRNSSNGGAQGPATKIAVSLPLPAHLAFKKRFLVRNTFVFSGKFGLKSGDGNTRCQDTVAKK